MNKINLKNLLNIDDVTFTATELIKPACKRLMYMAVSMQVPLGLFASAISNIVLREFSHLSYRD